MLGKFSNQGLLFDTVLRTLHLPATVYKFMQQLYSLHYKINPYSKVIKELQSQRINYPNILVHAHDHLLSISKISKQSSGVVLQKKMFLKILQNSLENTCVRVSFLIKLQASGTAIFLRILRNF